MPRKSHCDFPTTIKAGKIAQGGALSPPCPGGRPLLPLPRQTGRPIAEAPHLHILDAWMGAMHRQLMNGESCIARSQLDLRRRLLLWLLLRRLGWRREEGEGAIRVQQDIVEDMVGVWYGASMV